MPLSLADNIIRKTRLGGNVFDPSSDIKSYTISESCKAYLQFCNEQVYHLARSGVIDFHAADSTNVDLGVKFIRHRESLENQMLQKIILSSLLTLSEFLDLIGSDYKYRDFGDTYIPILYDMLLLANKEQLLFIRHKFPGFVCKNGLILLSERLITLFEISQFSNFDEMLTDNAVKCLRDKVVFVKDAIEISKIKENLTHLFSDSGLYALNNELITINDAKTYSLSFLGEKNALTLLQEELMTVEQLSEFNPQYSSISSVLERDNGVQILRDKLIKPEQIKQVDTSLFLYRPVAWEALRRQFIRPEQTQEIKNLDKLFADENWFVIPAMEFGLFTLSDFGKVPEKQVGSFIANIRQRYMDFLQEQYGEAETNIIIAQKQIRVYNANSKLTLFGQIQQSLSSGNMKMSQVRKLGEIVSLAYEGKVCEASERMAKL
jgi:hypothetical protein